MSLQAVCAFRLVFLISFVASLAAITNADVHKYTFILEPKNITRLCKTYELVVVNGQLPGPTIHVRNGDSLIVEVYNRAKYNATIHWHGVRQLRTGWADGPGYITQCPIQPGGRYAYRFNITDQEGTLWWHAHVSWLLATVHGAFVIYPKKESSYPFPKPHGETPLVLGEWWDADPIAVIGEALRTGGRPNLSDAYTLNGQPGDLYNCSTAGTIRFLVKQGETYLLRMVNAALNSAHFFKIAGHKFTVVAVDASYTKPYQTDVIVIAPGQTTDVLVTADQPVGRYYMAARDYNNRGAGHFDNTTATAIFEYVGHQNTRPILPKLPYYNDTAVVTRFSTALRSLNSKEFPVEVPHSIDDSLIATVGVGLLPCEAGNYTCQGHNGTRLIASMNNMSFVLPSVALLQAYYFGINGVFMRDFPSKPPFRFNYTGDNIPKRLWDPELATKVRVVTYNSTVQLVYQTTNILVAENHPMHLHGYDFYVVGQGFGNYNPKTDPLNFNLVDPPQRNTVIAPVSGWVAIRFKADNPGMWFLHCHLDDHLTLGLSMVFLVQNGQGPLATLEPPPADLPKC